MQKTTTETDSKYLGFYFNWIPPGYKSASLLLEWPTRGLRFDSRPGCWKLYHVHNLFSLKPNFVCKGYWNISYRPSFLPLSPERRSRIVGVSAEIRTLTSRIQIELYLWNCYDRYFLCISFYLVTYFIIVNDIFDIVYPLRPNIPQRFGGCIASVFRCNGKRESPLWCPS